MKKLFLLSLCAITIVSTCEAASLFRNPTHRPQYYRIKKTPSPYHNTHAYTNNNSQLTQMEQALFHKNYTNENINTRLNRLEENMFGETIPGTISQRYKNLSNAFQYNQPNPYYNPYGHYHPGPYSQETNKKLNIINKLANFLGGTPTGLTPNLDSGFSYDEGYSSPFGNGYFSQNQNYGRGMGVHIIND